MQMLIICGNTWCVGHFVVQVFSSCFLYNDTHGVPYHMQHARAPKLKHDNCAMHLLDVCVCRHLNATVTLVMVGAIIGENNINIR